MFSHAPVGLVPTQFRPQRRPETRQAAAPTEARLDDDPQFEEAPWADFVEPEPVAEPAAPEPVMRQPTPVAPPSYNMTRTRKRWRKEDAAALQRCSNALGYFSRCDSACCVRAKRCLWARGGRCFREAVLPPAEPLWR